MKNSDEPIKQGDAKWETLMELWISEKKPGWVTESGGMMYKVIAASDEDIRFYPVPGGIDGLYSTRSTRGIAR